MEEITLNKQQELAANHIDGPCLVVSVPGSGKTRLLTERAARLIESGINPKNIVCVTFTNKAAKEMKSRISKRLNISQPKCYIGTFHALCVAILKKFGHRLGYSNKFTIADSNDQVDLIRQIARQAGTKLEIGEARSLAKKVNNYRENMWDYGQLETELYDNSSDIFVVNEYIKRLKSSNIIDFSGLLSETAKLMDEYDEVRNKIQSVMKYILVDESQDTNLIQFYLLNLFSAKYNNIMLVGDPSQSIYSFRGSRHQNLRDFIDKHQDCRIVHLPVNYRSTPQIVARADQLIKHNSSHMADKFETVNKDGEEVFCFSPKNQISEGYFIADRIKRLVEEGGWLYEDMVVLYRMNSMSEPIERVFTNSGIPYEVIGNRSFYDRKEIKDCIAMIKFLINPNDGIAFHRISSTLKGIGDVSIGRIETFANENDVDIIHACKHFADSGKYKSMRESCNKLVDIFSADISGLSAAECVHKIMTDINYTDYLEKYDKECYMDRVENVNQFVDSAAEFCRDNEDNSIEKYLEMISLMTASDKEVNEDKVSLMTIHAVKGLEFPIVFIIGVEEGILPHYLSMKEDPEEGFQEETRIMFVAMTRSKHLLHITYCKQRTKFAKGGHTYDQDCKPSQFLLEAGLLSYEDFIEEGGRLIER